MSSVSAATCSPIAGGGRRRKPRGWIVFAARRTKHVDPEYDDSVSREFAALKPRERALLWLAYVEGESHEEIANALGLSRGSIKVLLSRARGRLRD